MGNKVVVLLKIFGLASVGITIGLFSFELLNYVGVKGIFVYAIPIINMAFFLSKHKL